MGGTFNPPHLAHIHIARRAMEELGLSKVIFMTGGNPPHKETDLNGKIRHHMTKLAIENEKDFEVWDYEIKKKEYSYTSDTLRYLNEKYPDYEIYFIIGGDSFDKLFSWHEPLEIIKRCKIVVYPRDGYPKKKDVDEFNLKYNKDVYLLNVEEEKMSSTDIRNLIENGEDATEYLDKNVYDYIKRNGIYKRHNNDYSEHLKTMLTKKRFEHSINVAKMAVKLAEHYGIDIKKAELAGLLHDCAKDMEKDELIRICIDLEAEVDEFELAHCPLLHAKAGAELIKTEFGVWDEEIASAIRWHTIGRVGMTELEKVIFIADMIEEGRCYPEVEYLREEAYTTLDNGMYQCILAIIRFNEAKKKDIHPNAYDIKNHYEKRR